MTDMVESTKRDKAASPIYGSERRPRGSAIVPPGGTSSSMSHFSRSAWQPHRSPSTPLSSRFRAAARFVRPGRDGSPSRPTLVAKPPPSPKTATPSPESWVRSASRPYHLFTTGAAAPTARQRALKTYKLKTPKNVRSRPTSPPPPSPFPFSSPHPRRSWRGCLCELLGLRKTQGSPEQASHEDGDRVSAAGQGG